MAAPAEAPGPCGTRVAAGTDRNRVDCANHVAQVDALVSHNGTGLGLDTLAKVRAHTPLAEHVDVRAQQVFKILPQAHEIEQTPSGVHLDKEINVADRDGVTSGHRARHSDVAGAVARCAAQDLLAATTQALEVRMGRLHIGAHITSQPPGEPVMLRPYGGCPFADTA